MSLYFSKDGILQIHSKLLIRKTSIPRQSIKQPDFHWDFSNMFFISFLRLFQTNMASKNGLFQKNSTSL